MPNITYCNLYRVPDPEPAAQAESNFVWSPGAENPDNPDPIKQPEERIISGEVVVPGEPEDNQEFTAEGTEASPEFMAEMRREKFGNSWPVYINGIERTLRDAIGFNQGQLASMMDWVRDELTPMAAIFIVENNDAQLEIIRFRIRSKIRDQEYAVHKQFEKVIVSTIVETIKIIRSLVV